VLAAVSLSPAARTVRTRRQWRRGEDDKQVIVNIENEDKTQYLEQNFNSSKIKMMINLISSFKGYKAEMVSKELRFAAGFSAKRSVNKVTSYEQMLITLRHLPIKCSPASMLIIKPSYYDRSVVLLRLLLVAGW